MTTREQMKVKALEQAVELLKVRSQPAGAEEVAKYAKEFYEFLKSAV